MNRRLLSLGIYITASLVGVLAYLYPFLFPGIAGGTSLGAARTTEMPLLLTLMVGMSLLVLLFELQGHGVETKLVALLGVLVAINSALRFIEIAIPGPGGFSPIFFLIILTGYVYGGRFGFLMGSLTMLVSALVTGGVGPWLPSQMLAAGWTGMSAALLRPLSTALKTENRRGEIFLLAFFGGLWGVLYGVIMNLWSWPFITGPESQSWMPGMDFALTLRRYTAYYLVTSLLWDLVRAAGSFALLLLFAEPALRAMRRFKRRFDFEYSRAPGTITTTEAFEGKFEPPGERNQKRDRIHGGRVIGPG